MRWFFRRAEKDPTAKGIDPSHRIGGRAQQHSEVTPDPGISAASGGWDIEQIDTVEEAAEALDPERALHLSSLPTVTIRGQEFYAVPTELVKQISRGSLPGEKTIHKGKEVYLIPVDANARNAPQKMVDTPTFDPTAPPTNVRDWNTRGSPKETKKGKGLRGIFHKGSKYRGDGEWS